MWCLRGRLGFGTRPHEHLAILVDREFPYLDEFELERFENFIVKLELEFERPI